MQMRVKLGDNLTIIKVGRDLKRVGKHCTKTLKCFLDQDLQTRFFLPSSPLHPSSLPPSLPRKLNLRRKILRNTFSPLFSRNSCLIVHNCTLYKYSLVKCYIFCLVNCLGLIFTVL